MNLKMHPSEQKICPYYAVDYQDFKIEALKAERGQVIEYFRGDLALAITFFPRNSDEFRALTKLRSTARNLAERGVGQLVQKRHGEHIYSYLFRRL